MVTTTAQYILGHEEQELNRLIEQARFYGDLTERLLLLAGLGRGMRVLDAGCGTGDVTFLAARIVGNDGMVIGIDNASSAIATARERAEQAGLTNVHFIEADIAEVELEAPVDAIIGRLILMHCPNPVHVVRQLARNLSPGGLVVFQDMDVKGARVEPMVPLVTQAIWRVNETFVRAGIDPSPGLRLPGILTEAGFDLPRTHCEARVELSPADQSIGMLVDITRTLLPLMERTAVATPEEVDIDTYAARLRDQIVAHNAVVMPPPLVGAWARRSRD